MCGIAGILRVFPDRSAPIDPAAARRMTDALVHRGPDDGDVHLEPEIALGHRRLSIIDLGGGHQPMFNEDGSVAVVFNGEIYNFAEIADELRRLGHVFRTRSDTEVIVHGWEQWGERCVERFRGMFAFALWDRGRRTLFLARDRLGVKPLHWAMLPDGQLLFASELKAIVAHPRFERRVDPCAIEEYLALGYVPDPRCIWQGAHKLPAAHTLTITAGRAPGRPRRYWRPVYEPKTTLTEGEAREELDALLTESVRLRMISDVPLGAFLSGGVDSSVVVAKMAQLSPGEPVRTCSIGFDEPDYDETEHAVAVAGRWNTDHVVRRVSIDDLSLVARLPSIYDEPFADSSAIATWRVSQLARERVKVVLSGDGGDEAFGGYRRYRLHLAEEAVRRRLPEGLRRLLFGQAARLYPQLDGAPRWLRARTTLESIGRSSVQAYFRAMSAVPDELRARLRSPALEAELQGYRAIEVFERVAAEFEGDDPLDLLQWIDLNTWLPGDINTKVDRASMAHSLEVRDPLLDHRVIEWAARLPRALRVAGGSGKRILRQVAEPLMPATALSRPKRGFDVPVRRWLVGALRETLDRAGDDDGPLAGRVATARLRAMAAEHAAGRRSLERPLWTVLGLALHQADHLGIERSAAHA